MSVRPQWWPRPVEPTIIQQLALRLGRRGLKLFVLGVLFAIIGADILFGPHQERFSRPGKSPLDWADSNYWGAVFIVGGLAAAAIGLRRRYAPDAIGFGALVAPALVWTAFYAYSFLVWLATDGVYGEPGRWVGAIVWGIIAFSIRIDAGWDDPTDPLLGRHAPQDTP